MVDKFILKLIVDNTRGVMARIATLLARKGYNIASICVGKHIVEGESSIVLTIYGNENEVETAKNTLGKIVNVISISSTHSSEGVEREHCLVKIAKDGKEKKILSAKDFEARKVQEGAGFMVFEFVDYPPRVNEFVSLVLRECRVIDISRSGTNAI